MAFHLENSKLHTFDAAIKHREELRKLGKTCVLTNGCFDLLHPGHLYYLQQAAKLGDELWIAINSSESVKQLKGPSRPILGDMERAYALAALDCVAGVFIFGAPRLDKEIAAFTPDVYTKAGDYTVETLDPSERQALEACNAQIKFMPFLQGFSTTQLIDKIKAAGSL